MFIKMITNTFVITVAIILLSSCSTKKRVKFIKKKIPAKSNVAVIIDCPDKAKNVVLAGFMKKKLTVKAINAADFYSLSDIYDIKDFKKVSYKSSLKDSQALLSMEKTYDNLYKLHVYNFEVNKAEVLNEMREKWGVNYLIILDLRDWESVSWGRAIDLNTYELIWVENYPTKFQDNAESIVNHFLRSISGSK